MAFDFTGKRILVTGAGRGMGRAISLGLVKAGCKVYALDCNEELLESLAAENPNITTIAQDLADWDGTRRALQKLGCLDGLVNNAGIVLGFKPALDHTREELDKYMDVNVLAAINCIQVIAKKMVKEGKKGSIVNIVSQVSSRAWPNLLGYTVSKAALEMVTKQFALELGPHNIRVNSVNPSIVETDIAKRLAEKHPRLTELHVERTPLGRTCELSDVVGPVTYLLSDCAAMVTGTSNLVDGGIACNITTKQ